MYFKIGLSLLLLALLAPTQSHPNQEMLKIVGGKLKSSLSVCADAGVGVLSSQTEGEIQYEPGDCFSSNKEVSISELDIDSLAKKLENHGAAGDQASASCGEANAAGNISQSNIFSCTRLYHSPGSSHPAYVNLHVEQSHQLQLSSSATGACTPWDLSCVAAAAGSFIVSEQETSVVFTTTFPLLFMHIYPVDFPPSYSFIAGGISLIGANGEAVFSTTFDEYRPLSSMHKRVNLQPGVSYTLKVWSKCNASVGVLSSCGTEEDNLNNIKPKLSCRLEFKEN